MYKQIIIKLKKYIRKFKYTYKNISNHSRIVLLLKIIIPGIISVFISFIVIFPQINTDIKKIRIAFPSINTLKKISFNIENGNFYGVNKDNTIFSVNVKNFHENKDEDFIKFNQINANLLFTNGNTIDLTTDKGTYIKKNNKFIMSNNVYIYNNKNDSKIYTDEAIIDLDDFSVSGTKPIKIILPFAKINSNSFNFSNDKIYNFTGITSGTVNLKSIK